MRIVRLFERYWPAPFSRGSAITALLVAGAVAGLIASEASSAQTPKPEHSTSTKQLTFDSRGNEYKQWLNQDVRWIIAPRERQAFLALSSDQERNEFVRQFWVRRNPNPDSPVNKFKQEHYRRLAYANMHFADNQPGWETDRGHVYIVFGPPDSIDAHPAAGALATKPFQVWHYRSIRVGWPPNLPEDANRHTAQPTVIKNFDFKFVDDCACGRYELESPWPLAVSAAPASAPAF
jgi:GWxTD domain-containing protein